MEYQKHLSIKEAINIRDGLENELELYLAKKRINYIKTQPSATDIKDVSVQKTLVNNDNLLRYMIKDEEYDLKIFELLESINSYEKYIIAELKRIAKIDPYKIKIYQLREDMEFIRINKRKRTYLEIGERLGYSEKQVRRIYKEIINGKK